MKTKKKPAVPRYFLDPDKADEFNPDGVVLNTGEWLPLGDTLDVMEDVGKPPHEFLQELEDLEVPYFRMGRDMAQALWRFPKWDILATM